MDKDIKCTLMFYATYFISWITIEINWCFVLKA